MTAAWAVELPASEKLVLLALADCANDEGHCWPGLASLCRKTGKCKRSLQESLRLLDKGGHITRKENPGKGMDYIVHPVAGNAPVAKSATGSKKCTGGKNRSKPVAKSAPKPLVTVISSEANASSLRTIRPWSLPPGVPLGTWEDFKTNRKRKRLGNTDSTWKTFCDDVERVSAQTGIPPPRLIEMCTGKGWGGIYDPRDNRNERHERQSNTAADAAGRILRDLGANDPAGQDPNSGRSDVHDHGSARALVARSH